MADVRHLAQRTLGLTDLQADSLLDARTPAELDDIAAVLTLLGAMLKPAALATLAHRPLYAFTGGPTFLEALTAHPGEVRAAYELAFDLRRVQP